MLILWSLLAVGACGQRPFEHTNGTMDFSAQSTVLAESLVDEAHWGLVAAIDQTRGRMINNPGEQSCSDGSKFSGRVGGFAMESLAFEQST